MSDKTLTGAALVTGASSGIGAIYAERLARRGHDLILAARDEGRLQALAERLRREHGVAVEVVHADLAQASDRKVLEDRLRRDPAIGVLVNNAGISKSGAFHEVDPDALEAVIELNVVALTRLARAAAEAFVARGSGTIINVGSVVGLMPEFRLAVYGATKAYVLYLSRALQVELGDRVRVQAVLPSATRTEIWDRSGTGLANVPEEILMEPGDLVDAALAGLDQGEAVTIPTLPDVADWDAFEAARVKLQPGLAAKRPAARYRTAAVEPA